MADEFGEKTEAPTAKRRKDAADNGQVLRSKELGTALGVLVGVAWIALFGPSLMAAFKAIMAASFTFGRGDVEDFEPWRPLAEAGWKLAPAMASVLAFALIGTIASQALLGPLRFNASLMAPKGSRIDPAAGLKRIFGPTGWIELGKSLMKVVLLGAIGGWMLWHSVPGTMGLVSSSDVQGAVGKLGATLTTILFAMAGGLVLIAGMDVPIQILRHLKQLRMSKQEIKDEHKETEGSPEAKGAIKARQRDMLRRSMRKAVAEAHVVLTNPTHFAVALRYDRGRDQVPVVVAKGRGVTALAIRDLAAETRLPVLEYPALARAVYYTSNEGQEVRDDLYQAIATVLAFVFGLNAQAGGVAQPPITVPSTARFDENGVRQ